MDTQRLKELSGMHPQYKRLQELRADRQAMIAAYDQLIRDVEQGQQLDEGLFDTLRATLATVGQLGAKGAKAAIDKTKQISKEVADKVKSIYVDEKSKIELENMIKNMKVIGEQLMKMGKDSGTIIKKDPEVLKAMETFDNLFKTTVGILESRLALAKGQKEKVEPTVD